MSIDSQKIKKLIEEASNIVVVAHKSLDLDALGSCFGVYYVASHLNKDAYILIDDTESELGVGRAINKTKELGYNIDIRNFNAIKSVIDKNTLLVIVDINRRDLIQHPEVLNIIDNKVLIDHHIKGGYSIKDLKYEYVNTEESSATEIVMDLIDDLGVYIPEYIATIMLSGIHIDTNDFYLKTNEATHEAAASLNKFGADMNELQYLLKQDFRQYIERQKIIINTEIINKEIAIAVGNPKVIYERSELAKTADTILLFNDIEASFVIGRTSKSEVSISARSLGKINVQTIMKRLNGGGHSTDAAAQLTEMSIEQVKKVLIKLILG